jgi:hypothetical protein
VWEGRSREAPPIPIWLVRGLAGHIASRARMASLSDMNLGMKIMYLETAEDVLAPQIKKIVSYEAA